MFKVEISYFVSHLYTINLYTIRSFDKLTFACHHALNLYSRKLHVVNNLNFDSVNCEYLGKGNYLIPISNMNGECKMEMEIHFIQKRWIFSIMRLFVSSIETFPIIHIPEWLAPKHTSIHIQRLTFNLPFVKWTAVVQLTKSERRDVCSCGLTLSNGFDNLFNGKLHILSSADWNYSIHDKSNSTEIQLKGTASKKLFRIKLIFRWKKFSEFICRIQNSQLNWSS